MQGDRKNSQFPSNSDAAPSEWSPWRRRRGASESPSSPCKCNNGLESPIGHLHFFPFPFLSLFIELFPSWIGGVSIIPWPPRVWGLTLRPLRLQSVVCIDCSPRQGNKQRRRRFPGKQKHRKRNLFLDIKLSCIISSWNPISATLVSRGSLRQVDNIYEIIDDKRERGY